MLADTFEKASNNYRRGTLVKNRKGLGLIEVLVSIVILSIFIFTTQKSLQYAQKSQSGGQLGFDLMVARNNIVTMLSQPEVWSQIKLNNVNMDCLRNSTDCTGDSGDFDIYQYDQVTSAVALYYSSTPAANGLTKDGAQCTSFVAPGSPGNALCPLRVVLHWEPICTATPPCLNPNVRLKGTFTVNTPQESNAINTDRLNFEMIQ